MYFLRFQREVLEEDGKLLTHPYFFIAGAKVRSKEQGARGKE